MSEKDKNSAPRIDFDWEAFENGTYPEITKEELDKAYEATLRKVTPHQVVDGTIISMDNDNVVVNIGFKSDGIISASEFAYNPELKVGDIVKVYIVKSGGDQLVLSHNIAIGVESVIDDIDDEEIFDNDHLFYDNSDVICDIEEKKDDEYIPDKSLMKYTHGVFSPCPYCGSKSIRTYTDGTAKCESCKQWFCYQI